MYNSLRRHKTLVFSLADAGIGILAMVGSFLMRFEGTIPLEYVSRVPLYCGLMVSLNFASLIHFNSYRFRWDYVSLAELKQLFKGLFVSHLVFAATIVVEGSSLGIFTGFPRSVVLLSFILNFVGIGGLRISKRLYKEFVQPLSKNNGSRTLIVGTGSEAEALIRSMRTHSEQPYKIIGMVEVNRTMLPVTIHGVPVVGKLTELADIISRKSIEQLIIALSSADRGQIRDAIERARVCGVTNIKIIPDSYEVLTQSDKLLSLRAVAPEDLLGRDPAKLDTTKMTEKFEGKTIMVTGAAGSIGSELVRQLINFKPAHIIAYDNNESGLYDLDASLLDSVHSRQLISVVGSVTNERKVRGVLTEFKPEFVFHAAAYKHVPFMEQYPEEAIEVNVLGTYTVAKAAQDLGVKHFVLVSTDKAINPISVMGKTKRAAELIVQALNAEGKNSYIAVRFGNVLGSRGSVVPLFQDLIRRRLPLTVTHPEMTRFFMTIREAALLVLEAGAIGMGGEIFMLDMGKPVRIVDLAYDLIRLNGLEPDKDIPVVFTKPRPGEKIHEEIFSDQEKSVGATQWEKIHISQTKQIPSKAHVEKHLADLMKQFMNREHRSLITPIESRNADELLPILNELVA